MSRSLLGGRENQITHANVDIELMEFKARFTRQLFWHGARLNLVPVPKICGPAPFIFVV